MMYNREKMTAIAKDLLELCKKHDIAIMGIRPDTSGSEAQAKLIEERSLFSFTILDGGKAENDARASDIQREIGIDKMMALDSVFGQIIQYGSSIVLKLNKKRCG